MNSSDSSANENNIKALFVSAWQAKKKETLRIDLWTKDMPVNEMFIFYHQSLLSMAQTLEKSKVVMSDYLEHYEIIVIFLLNKHK